MAKVKTTEAHIEAMVSSLHAVKTERSLLAAREPQQRKRQCYRGCSIAAPSQPRILHLSEGVHHEVDLTPTVLLCRACCVCRTSERSRRGSKAGLTAT